MKLQGLSPPSAARSLSYHFRRGFAGFTKRRELTEIIVVSGCNMSLIVTYIYYYIYYIDIIIKNKH